MSKLKLSDITVVTSNKNKLSEINGILGTNHKVYKNEIPEIQSLDLNEVITAKAKYAHKILKKPVLVEDVSLEIKSLKGLPGTFVKFFLSTLGAAGTVSLVKNNNTSTKVTAAVAIYDGKILKIFKGSLYGTLSPTEKGDSGFGFDKVFIPRGYTQTMAQQSIRLKNKISHRAIVFRKVKKYLTS